MNVNIIRSRKKIKTMTSLMCDCAVETIREIAKQLNKKDWNFSDPCSNKTTIDSPHTKLYNNTIICNCTSANFCHVEILYASLCPLLLSCQN